jgi:hypothetical protein
MGAKEMIRPQGGLGAAGGTCVEVGRKKKWRTK